MNTRIKSTHLFYIQQHLASLPRYKMTRKTQYRFSSETTIRSCLKIVIVLEPRINNATVRDYYEAFKIMIMPTHSESLIWKLFFLGCILSWRSFFHREQLPPPPKKKELGGFQLKVQNSWPISRMFCIPQHRCQLGNKIDSKEARLYASWALSVIEITMPRNFLYQNQSSVNRYWSKQLRLKAWCASASPPQKKSQPLIKLQIIGYNMPTLGYPSEVLKSTRHLTR